ncbi:hypothetical protein DE146DRAFT_769964 [Phaeosphaeria sp. MPI-PUGE-AT-0046c]|nr:hypothetical protein DE146DRAFT_769964 [Phaeosphaeria sp. MPI-PUGE-AT-0046c]
MGIPQLFDVVRDYEETIPIAQLAEEHHQRHGTPLRIAVDEADWRFNNVTQAQVYAIRAASDQAYQGQEKTMFYRICRFLNLGIQLIFVFDGPGRPWKRGGRGGGKIDYRARDLLKEVLRHLGIPYHEAPGEAEAECARLQILGLVDAVWSQDSDCLMFGCTTWIRDDRVVKEKGTHDRSKENSQKSKKTARIVQAYDLKQRLQIDREGLVLFAMLVGGDYDTKGLPGCGPKIAMIAVQRGLGQTLCACRNQRDCDTWSHFKTLVKYNTPKVTPDHLLLNNSRLDLNIVRPINELKLIETTSSRFNIWGKRYMDWVGPILLARALSGRDPTLPREVVHGIVLVKEKAKTDENGVPKRVFERKIRFSPVTSLKKADFEGERRGYWTGKDADPFDPSYRVERCEMPDYLLQKVLPTEFLNPPPPQPKSKPAKRAAQVETNTSADSHVAAKRQRIAHAAAATPLTKFPRSRTTTKSTTPPRTSQNDYPFSRSDLFASGDDDLRLALHLSAQEQVTPSWRGSQFSKEPTGSAQKPPPGPSASSTHSTSKRGPFTTGAAQEGPWQHYGGSPRGSALCTAASIVTRPELAALRSSPAKTSLSNSSAVDDIRAARIRHFQHSPVIQSSTGDTPRVMPQSHLTPSRAAGPKFNVPAGISCIDLTDD